MPKSATRPVEKTMEAPEATANAKTVTSFTARNAVELSIAQSSAMLLENAAAHVQRIQILAEASQSAAIRAAKDGKSEEASGLQALAQSMVSEAQTQYAQALSYVNAEMGR